MPDNIMHNDFITLDVILRLSTFRKCESLTTEELVQQESAHGDHAIYYSKSIGAYWWCTSFMQRLQPQLKIMHFQ